jgi:zinc transporter, ZIP family
MGVWLAALSGLIAGGALLLGAAVAWFFSIPKAVVAAIMALGAGVLISTLAFELVEEAAADGGLVPTVSGFLAGAVIYIVADWLVSRPRGDGRRVDHPSVVVRRAKARPGRGTGSAAGNGGVAIAIGSLIDGIPESIVLGLSVLQGGLSIPIVAAIAISNIPEGLGSTAELKRGGHSGRGVAAMWIGIAAISVLAAVVGNLAFENAPTELVAIITTIAAGGLLAMICNTMIPEAFAEQRLLTGLWATIGFLCAFILHEVS